jgi:hypothetical protein
MLRLISRIFPIRLTALYVSIVIFVVIPSVFLAIQMSQSFYDVLITASAHMVVFLIPAGVLLVFPSRYRFVRHSMSLAMAAYGLIMYFLIGHRVATGGSFDLYFALDSISDVPATVRDVIGVNGLTFFVLLIVCVAGIFYAIETRALLRLSVVRACVTRRSWAFLCVLMFSLLWIMPPENGVLSANISQISDTANARAVIVPAFIDTSVFSTDSDDSIFILQLESLNALAMEGRAVVDERSYPDIHNIHFRNVAKDGVFFPLFWGNTVQTNRAQETILCGVTNNIGDSFSYHPDDLTGFCLPKILNDSGYDSVFMSAYDDGNFANTDEFMEMAGFTDIRFGDMMVEGEDTRYPWGYDDCDFYGRSFDYLKKEYPDPSRKKLVYFEASANHVPFNPKEGYDDSHIIAKPSNFIEKYINSAREQDTCIARFYERFLEYTGGNAHLIIAPDTSWPVGINGNTYNQNNAFNDNFLTSFAYIPPVSGYNDIKRGSVVDSIFSQTDVLSTLFEIMNRKSYQNSFAWAMRGEEQIPPHYEDCHVLSQPYGGGMIAVVSGVRKVIYSISDRTVTQFDLASDLLEQNPDIIARNMSYDDFKDEYFCPRMKDGYGTRTLVFKGPVHLGDEVVPSDWEDDARIWKKVIGDGPRDEFSFSFDLEPGIKISHVEFLATDMEGGHSVLLNNVPIGTTCSTGVEKLFLCMMDIKEQVTVADRKNLMTIRLGKNLQGDDFLIDEIYVIATRM